MQNHPAEHSSSEPHDRETLRPEIVDGMGNDRNSGHHTQQPRTPFVTTESGAIVAFGLAVASWFVIPIVGAIAALFVASGAKRKIRQSEGELSGRSLATAAQGIAIANLLLGVIVVWLVIALLRWIF